MHKQYWLCLMALHWAPGAVADYKNDIGYAALQTLLGANTPTGDGVNVVQAEASLAAIDKPTVYAPNIADTQFSGKTFYFPGTPSALVSSHATSVGWRFYGNEGIAPGIKRIASYDANEWLQSLVPSKTQVALPPVNASRIANHSWIAGGEPADAAGLVLRLVDRQVQHNEFIQVVGMNNNVSNAPLMGSAYNVIAVGRTDGLQDRGSDAVDAVYAAGRTRPDLVAPQTTTSAATPIVAAAAALLVETGHKAALAVSNGSINIDGVGTVYNGERAETVKAALMAGADRITDNTSTTANIADYRAGSHQTVNGLDDRFGAGQLNILQSYQIIAAGEQDSLEDDSGAGDITAAGFDYDGAFGGLDSNITATYKITALADLNLTASLVWNLGVSNDSSLVTSLHDLDLELFDTTAQTSTAFSASKVDNSENLWVNLAMGHHYQLSVKSGEANPFAWDYALAWHMKPLQTAPVPLPSAFYLFVGAIGSLGWLSRRKA
ncbi:hypothetical protein QZJ86_04620 [Methylomonas montana]|uniref:hypothetical protein n=1 Tax=Methylomonas montana TaxID=3058963 RepID=UPI00265A596D|nr:hypothetical protein [Methylomonas montana]WKJ91420.1 hypothetical protein QZJ86_04620 [Methylomonas montana]